MKTSLELALSNCLEDIRRGKTAEEALSLYPEHRAELELLVCIALSVDSLPKDIAPSPKFKAATKELILREIAAGQRSRVATSRWSAAPARAAGIAAALILSVTLAGAGTVYAALDTVPGDPLYGFKVASEKARLALAFSEDERGSLYITMAENRLDEMTRVTQRNPQAVQGLAAEYERSVIQARAGARRSDDAELLRRIEERVSNHVEALQTVYQAAPPAAQPAIAMALEASQQTSDKTPALPAQNASATPPIPTKDSPQPATAPVVEKAPSDPNKVSPSVPLPTGKDSEEAASSEPTKGLPGQPAPPTEALPRKEGTTPHTDQPIPITAKDDATTATTPIGIDSKQQDTNAPGAAAPDTKVTPTDGSGKGNNVSSSAKSSGTPGGVNTAG